MSSDQIKQASLCFVCVVFLICFVLSSLINLHISLQAEECQLSQPNSAIESTAVFSISMEA